MGAGAGEVALWRSLCPPSSSVMEGGGRGEENIIWQVEPRGEGGVENRCQEREKGGGEDGGGRREGRVDE